MERFDISEDDRLAWMIDAVQRGETVEITRDGAIVAEIVAPAPHAARRTPRFDPSEWEALHRRLPPDLLGGNGAEELRALRDAD